MKQYPEDQAQVVAEFRAWLMTRDASEFYNYMKPQECAFAQFLKDQEYAQDPVVGPWDWNEQYFYGPPLPNRYPVPQIINNAVRNGTTFGGALQRLDLALVQETMA